jgi:hypothetical protein
MHDDVVNTDLGVSHDEGAIGGVLQVNDRGSMPYVEHADGL